MTAVTRLKDAPGLSAVEELEQQSAAAYESLSKALGLPGALEPKLQITPSNPRVKWGGKVLESNAARRPYIWGKKQR